MRVSHFTFLLRSDIRNIRKALDSLEAIGHTGAMRKPFWIRASCLALALGGLVMGEAISTSAQDDLGGSSVRVLHVEGAVRYSLKGNPSWKKLKAGQSLEPGVLIQTAKTDGIVELRLGGPAAARGERAVWQKPEENYVRLLPDSALQIQQLSVNGTGSNRMMDVSLILRAGQIAATIAPAALESRYEVTFDNGAAALQPGTPASAPTVFVLSKSGNLAVLEGAMLLAKADTEVHTEVISAGEKFDAATGVLSKLPADAPERRLVPTQLFDSP